MKKLLNLSNPFNSVSALKIKSDNIFNVFKNTMNDLSKVNSEIAQQVKTREDQINSLQEEVTTLVTIKTNNEKMVNKIQNFLNS